VEERFDTLEKQVQEVEKKADAIERKLDKMCGLSRYVVRDESKG
jgi:hypothetical protein